MKFLSQVAVFSALLISLCLTESVFAISITSTTAVQLTFRPCTPGTACEKFGRADVKIYEGMPGDQTAEANREEAAYGSASGSVRLQEAIGNTFHTARAVSLLDSRNGGNTVTLQKYTNAGDVAETITFSGTLSYDQKMPESIGGRSAANAEIVVLSMDVDELEVGASVEENMALLFENPEGIETVELGFEKTPDHSNLAAAGEDKISITVTVQPGTSVWLFSILQSLSANGADITGTFTTRLDRSPI